MAFHNNGRKYYHLLECNGKSHWYITDGMLFGLDEIMCKRHKEYTAILKSNMNKYEAELQMEGTK